MTFRSSSLRTQLFLLGMASVVIPLFALVLVVSASSSSEEVSVAQDSSGLADDRDVEQTTSESEAGAAALPPEVLIAALLLAAAGSTAVWIWTGRAVRPVTSITAVADEIQTGSLDRRIRLEGAASDVQALADSFDRMLDRLSTASATQRRLVEDTSHELRTPLAALAVNNEVILGNDSPTTDEYRASAERNEALIERLQLTMDELLRGARGRTESTRQVDNDLMAIVDRVVNQHRTVNPEIPVLVKGPDTLLLGIDGPSVQRALVNLVENAARYSPTGAPVTIDVIAEPATSLSVTDHGPGIKPRDLAHVFDRYYQGDPSDSTGAGIGLALVKQVAEAHGRIEVVSPLPGDDHGTRFTLTFTATPQTGGTHQPRGF